MFTSEEDLSQYRKHLSTWQVYENTLEVELTKLINEYTKEKVIKESTSKLCLSSTKSKLLISHRLELDTLIQKVEELCRSMQQESSEIAKIPSPSSNDLLLMNPDFTNAVNNILQQTLLETSAAQTVCSRVRLQAPLEQMDALAILACFHYKPYNVKLLFDLVAATTTTTTT